MLNNVYDLDLSGCDKITDVSMLGGTCSLNLSGCDRITCVDGLGSVKKLIGVIFQFSYANGNKYGLHQ